MNCITRVLAWWRLIQDESSVLSFRGSLQRFKVKFLGQLSVRMSMRLQILLRLHSENDANDLHITLCRWGKHSNYVYLHFICCLAAELREGPREGPIPCRAVDGLDKLVICGIGVNTCFV